MYSFTFQTFVDCRVLDIKLTTLTSNATNTAAFAFDVTIAAIGPHFNALVMDHATHSIRHLANNVIAFNSKASCIEENEK